VSLEDIERVISEGATVEIVDSQTGEDLTRSVLTQIILERQPEKMALFPADMLHFILRSNDLMADFLRDYFRQSLTYLDYLQSHGPTAAFSQPMHWMNAWLEQLSQRPAAPRGTPDREQELERRVAELEQRLRQLESQDRTN
jgi:polyhydroxyalkanoate synthesis repressor PhaR